MEALESSLATILNLVDQMRAQLGMAWGYT